MTGRVTVVGARGFVGSAVVARARESGFDVLECRHDDVPGNADLGTVVYCAGVAWDADRRPVDAYRTHVAAVAAILENGRYDRLVYISSTRVYDRSDGTAEETPLRVRSDLPGDTYALSKLAGEGAVLSARSENRVLRCSNIYGPSLRSGLFLSDVLRQAATTGRIALRSSLDSSKDYVSVDDVARLSLQVAHGSDHAIYNVAAGTNTTHRSLLEVILQLAPVDVDIAAGSPTVVVPPIDIRRIQREFGFEARPVIDDLPSVVKAFLAGCAS